MTILRTDIKYPDVFLSVFSFQKTNPLNPLNPLNYI
jgi:hypothetical protein